MSLLDDYRCFYNYGVSDRGREKRAGEKRVAILIFVRRLASRLSHDLSRRNFDWLSHVDLDVA